MKATPAVLGVLLANLVACSGSGGELSSPNSDPNGTTSSSSGGASNTGGGTDAGGDASAADPPATEDENAGAKCNTLAQLGGPTKVVGVTYGTSVQGGTLADGTYVLVGEKVYSSPIGGGGQPIDGMASATIKVVGTTLQVVLSSTTYGEQRATYTMKPNTKSFGLTRTCLYVAKGEDIGIMPLTSLTGINYTATATQLTFVKPLDSVAFEEWNFVKQ